MFTAVLYGLSWIPLEAHDLADFYCLVLRSVLNAEWPSDSLGQVAKAKGKT
jgi:hypothetical protein